MEYNRVIVSAYRILRKAEDVLLYNQIKASKVFNSIGRSKLMNALELLIALRLIKKFKKTPKSTRFYYGKA